MLKAIKDGFAAVRRSWGLVVLLLTVNVSLAAVLAGPLAGILEADLKERDAAANMLYGFDYTWWSRWSESQGGWRSALTPDILGTGFAFKNVDLLLKGWLPARLFVRPDPEEERYPTRASSTEASGPGLDPVILGLGVVYFVVQTFLAGGILGVLRGPQGSWTVRGLLHGAGFYFGRFVRIALLALFGAWVVFRLNAPFARWADLRAVEAVSETTAMVWTIGRHAVLLLALLFVNMISSYAKVITVLEERSSTVLACLSSLTFCFGTILKTAGHYLSLTGMAVLLLLAWSALDGRWETTGYKSQVVALFLAQGLVASRLALRLALWGGQIAIYRRGTNAPDEIP